MNQSKFSLADLLTVLATIIFGFVCFMGANYLNICNDKVWGMNHTIGCILIAVVCSGLLFATAYGAKLFKRTSRNFKSCFVAEIILLTLFVLFALFFATKTSPFTHYFTVRDQKENIKSKLRISIAQAEKMFNTYESDAKDRKANYKKYLSSVVAFKGINKPQFDSCFPSNGGSIEQQIDRKMFIIHNNLFPSYYSDTITRNGLREVATGWLLEAQDYTSGWKPISIVGVVCEIEKNSIEWRDTLVTLWQVKEKGDQAGDFKYPLSFDNVKAHFTKLDNPTPLSITFALLAYISMLLSWFVTKRSDKGKDAFTTKPYEVVL